MMLEPATAAACVQAMGENSGGVPVTVKCRIGVDDRDTTTSASSSRRWRGSWSAPQLGGKPLFATTRGRRS